MTRIARFPLSPESRRAIAQAIGEGSVMTYPTETSYALGGNALEPGLCGRVQALKGRDVGKPLLLLVGSEEQAESLAPGIHPAARELMRRFWPGPLTLVFSASPNVPPHLATEQGTIALRWSPHPALAELIGMSGVPLIGTSANITGQPPLCTAEQVLAAFPGTIALAIDAGPAPGGPPSTLVDTTVVPFRILREGALPKPRIQATLVETFIETVPE